MTYMSSVKAAGLVDTQSLAGWHATWLACYLAESDENGDQNQGVWLCRESATDIENPCP